MQRVELTRVADEALTAMPDDVHEELLALIDSVADAPHPRPGRTVVFGASSWVTCSVMDGVVELLDVGWTG
ncbi:hypothetical protein [Streptomyces sp. NPDC020607]|uniref:hypothetical protein n=1 Tax=Streptomyces sp. NPDC020607 TaxID=3365082 RepID=UPI0037A4F757